MISVLTQLFSWEALEGLLEQAGFLKTVLKSVDIQDNKKHNPDGPSLISEVSESSERASESKFEFALPKKKYKCLLTLSGVTKRMISNVSLKTILKGSLSNSAKSSHNNKSQHVILLVLLEIKALIKALDGKQDSLSTWALWLVALSWAAKHPC